LWDKENKKCYVKLRGKIHIKVFEGNEPFADPIYENFLDVELENPWFDRPNFWQIEIEKPVIVKNIIIGSDTISINLEGEDNEVFPSIFKGTLRIKKKKHL